MLITNYLFWINDYQHLTNSRCTPAQAKAENFIGKTDLSGKQNYLQINGWADAFATQINHILNTVRLYNTILNGFCHVTLVNLDRSSCWWWWWWLIGWGWGIRVHPGWRKLKLCHCRCMACMHSQMHTHILFDWMWLVVGGRHRQSRCSGFSIERNGFSILQALRII